MRGLVSTIRDETGRLAGIAALLSLIFGAAWLQAETAPGASGQGQDPNAPIVAATLREAAQMYTTYGTATYSQDPTGGQGGAVSIVTAAGPASFQYSYLTPAQAAAANGETAAPDSSSASSLDQNGYAAVAPTQPQQAPSFALAAQGMIPCAAEIEQLGQQPSDPQCQLSWDFGLSASNCLMQPAGAAKVSCYAAAAVPSCNNFFSSVGSSSGSSGSGGNPCDSLAAAMNESYQGGQLPLATDAFSSVLTSATSALVGPTTTTTTTSSTSDPFSGSGIVAPLAQSSLTVGTLGGSTTGTFTTSGSTTGTFTTSGSSTGTFTSSSLTPSTSSGAGAFGLTNMSGEVSSDLTAAEADTVSGSSTLPSESESGGAGLGSTLTGPNLTAQTSPAINSSLAGSSGTSPLVSSQAATTAPASSQILTELPYTSD